MERRRSGTGRAQALGAAICIVAALARSPAHAGALRARSAHEPRVFSGDDSPLGVHVHNGHASDIRAPNAYPPETYYPKGSALNIADAEEPHPKETYPRKGYAVGVAAVEEPYPRPSRRIAPEGPDARRQSPVQGAAFPDCVRSNTGCALTGSPMPSLQGHWGSFSRRLPPLSGRSPATEGQQAE